MNEEKLSVIIPIFNGEMVIERCLNSVRNQYYSNIEIIVVDDGSTDSTYSICNKVAEEDARVKVYHKENGGASSARNYGIDCVTGKYLMFIDGDDTIDSHYLESFMRFKEYIDQKIIVIARIDIYVNGRYVPSSASTIVEDNIILDINKLTDIWDARLWNSPVNKIYITDVIKKYNIRFDINFAMGEDWLFNNEYARKLHPTGYYIFGEARYRYDMDSNPWRHCNRDALFEINKYQVEDFKKTLRELDVSSQAVSKFEKRDIDFTISEIRYIVRERADLSICEKLNLSKKLFDKERLKIRMKQLKKEFSKEDYFEFSVGNMLLILVWENIKRKLGEIRMKL